MSQEYGPTLPNNVNTSSVKQTVIGPTLPPHLLQCATSNEEPVTKQHEQASTQNESLKDKRPKQQLEESYGPALPPNFKKLDNHADSENEEDYGPLPAGACSMSLTQQALEERALQLKLDFLQGVNQDKSEVREKWMLELPEVGGAHLSLGPRQFRKNERPDFSDRSSWTDTPKEKSDKAEGKKVDVVDLKKEAELREIAKRNKEKDKRIAEYNKKKKRDKSLVELHQEKIKKKKMDDGESSTSRRPFNREIDLKTNQFDAAQKKSIMNKAMHLDDRFSRGQSKYL